MGTTFAEEGLVLELCVFINLILGETPLLGNDDVLTTWELEGCTTESFDDVLLEHWLGTDGQEDLVNLDTSDWGFWLTVSTTHPGLETIRTCTGQHLVDTDKVEWVDTDTQVKGITTDVLDHVLVNDDTSSFQCVCRDLFEFTGDEVETKWERVGGFGLVTDIVNLQLCFWDTSQVTGLWIRLVLTITITTCWTATHVVCCVKRGGEGMVLKIEKDKC